MADRKNTRPSTKEVLKTIRRYYWLTKEYFFKYGIYRWFGGVASGGMQVLNAYLAGRMVGVAISGDMNQLVRYAAMLLGAVIVRTTLGVVNIFNNLRYSIYSGKKLRTLAMEKINALPIAYYEKTHSGDTISKLASDIEVLQLFYGNSIAGIWSWVPATFVFSLIVLLKTNVLLTLICGTIIPLFSFLMNKISIPMSKASKERQEHAAEYNSYLRDFAEGVHIYKSFGMETSHGRKFENACNEYAGKSFQIAKRRSMTFGLTGIGMLVPQVIALTVGSIFVMDGRLTVSDLFVFANVLWPFVSIFQQVTRGWADVIESAGKAENLFKLFDAESERTDGVDYTDLGADPIMEFSDVSFQYNESAEVLKSVSFTVERGRKTALVGASGSGKSTVHKMFAGHYDDYKGSVFFMGHELSEWNLEALRINIAAVNQDIYLFSESVMENIRYGNPESTDEMVMDAARQAYAHDFIMELENGYETKLGERGTSLSGGQRQRIAVARALLKDAPVVLLDEPTSALDTKSEYHVQKAIERLEEGRTVFIIAHRLSTIENADKIVVLDEGMIVGTGRHRELIGENERYISLYSRQVLEAEGGLS